MDLSKYPPDVQEYLAGLIKKNVISVASLSDKTLINHLLTQKFDEDYIRSMMNDR